jgi:tetratricopeptide (TPR) repeat protein
MKLISFHRLSLTFLFASSLLVCIEVANASPPQAASVRPQDSSAASIDLTSAIALYDRGDYQEAVEALRAVVNKRKDDLTARHYLGLSFEKLGQTAEAQKAHEKAARLGDSLVQGAIKTGADYVEALRSRRSELMQAAESADSYLSLARPTGSVFDEWTERSRSLRELVELASADGQAGRIYTLREVTHKARVLDVPEPYYVRDVRPHPSPSDIVQRVEVRGVFTADGRILALFLVRDSYDEFAVACIKSAHKIRFTPATKDGQPVAMYMTVEFRSIEEAN